MWRDCALGCVDGCFAVAALWIVVVLSPRGWVHLRAEGLLLLSRGDCCLFSLGTVGVCVWDASLLGREGSGGGGLLA